MKILLITLCLLGFNSLFAQTGAILGKVTDKQGNPLSGANVFVKGTTMGASTDQLGNFRIERLRYGTYNLEISMLGFEKKITGNIVLEEALLRINIQLEETALLSKQVIVTASKYEQQVTDLPVSAAVIGSDKIAERNIISLDNAMRYAPGVSMNLDQVSIRGSSGYSRGAGTRVLVAMDGIPLYTGDTGEIIWEIIPVTEIDRVEIIKGAASSLYGSTAIGGVINVITKDISREQFTYVKGYFGLYDKPSYSEWDWSGKYRPYNGLTLTHSGSVSSLGYTLSLTRTENSGYRQDDYFKRYTGFVKTVYNFTPKSSLTLLANYMGQTRGNFIYWKDAGHVLQPRDADQGQRVLSDRYMLALMYKNVISPDLFLTIRSSYYHTKWNDETSSHDTSASGLLRGEIQVNYRLSQKLFLTSGVESTTGNVNSNLFGKPHSFGTGVYTQADYKLNFPLTLSAGVRFDYSKLDTLSGLSSLSPRIGVNYKISGETVLRASAGRGFRAPTLAETFTSTTAGGLKIKPNPYLKSETNLSLEAGINQSFGNFIEADLAVFRNEYYDFIEPGVDPSDGLIIFRNLTRARIQGTEFNMVFNLIPERLNLNINYVYLWARNIEKNSPLKYRPRHLFYSSVDFKIGAFQFGTDFRFWSKIEALDYELVDLGLVKDGDKRVPVYVLDFRTGYNLLSLGLPGKILLNINNLLNYNYIEIIGNLSPIRNASVGLEMVF